ncbi:MAG: hypothetical protein R2853_11165 [Thermomicrobiales bacterium]
MGRALRRMSYAANDEEPEPEYAEVYGVPFSFIPGNGTAEPPKPGPIPTRVRALPERIAQEITFPRLIGYRYDLPSERLAARFGPDHHPDLTTQDVPTETETAPIIGEAGLHTLDDFRASAGRARLPSGWRSGLER